MVRPPDRKQWGVFLTASRPERLDGIVRNGSSHFGRNRGVVRGENRGAYSIRYAPPAFAKGCRSSSPVGLTALPYVRARLAALGAAGTARGRFGEGGPPPSTTSTGLSAIGSSCDWEACARSFACDINPHGACPGSVSIGLGHTHVVVVGPGQWRLVHKLRATVQPARLKALPGASVPDHDQL